MGAVEKRATRKRSQGTRSAGLLLYRFRAASLEVLLVHPGGPFWQHKDAGAWSIPKGEIDEGEDDLAAARREFGEETGYRPKKKAIDLGCVRQPGGKHVHAWAVEGDWDPTRLVSNAFEMEWPPHSGHAEAFPEIDKAAWFSLEDARTKILKGQISFLDRLAASLTSKS